MPAVHRARGPGCALSARIDAITGRIDELLRGIKQGSSTQAELDRYMIVAGLIEAQHPALTEENIDMFILPRKAVFDASKLPDLGSVVRQIFMRSKRSVMLSLLEYALPFTRNSRLSFPPCSSFSVFELRALVALCMASCLGLYPAATRRPVWTTRVCIFMQIHEILQVGDPRVMHDFCVRNIPLVRLSLVEYFVYFVVEHMPVESMLCHTFSVEVQNLQQIFTNICFVADSFRLLAVQGNLDWEKIRDTAAVVVEKINRMCKWRQAQKTSQHVEEGDEPEDPTILKLALQTPRFCHVQYAQCLGLGLDGLHAVRRAQARIRVFSLPRNIVAQQYEAVARMMRTTGPMSLEFTKRYVCLACPDTNKLQRVQTEDPTCDTCGSAEHVAAINCLGRLDGGHSRSDRQWRSRRDRMFVVLATGVPGTAHAPNLASCRTR